MPALLDNTLCHALVGLRYHDMAVGISEFNIHSYHFHVETGCLESMHEYNQLALLFIYLSFQQLQIFPAQLNLRVMLFHTTKL